MFQQNTSQPMTEISGRWWKPTDLLEAVEEIGRSVPDDEYFCDPIYKPIREAWVAASFAKGRPYNINWELFPVPEKEEFPDFRFRALSNSQDVRFFEITEADRENRRRCEEYRKAKGQPDEIEEFDPREEADAALAEIIRVINQKSKKGYRPKPNLLVYVNLWHREPTQLEATQIGNIYGGHFESIWLYWGDGRYRLWPNPKRTKASASS